MPVIIFACTSERPSLNGAAETTKDASRGREMMSAAEVRGNGETVAAIEVGPPNATRNTTLTATCKGINCSDAKLEWLVNGSPAPDHAGMQFKFADAKKGDIIQCRAISHGVEIKSNEVKIGNTPQEIVSMNLASEGYKPGEPLSMDVTGSDADGDPVIFLYEWTRNGQPAGKGKALEGPIKRGDKIAVKIIPYDGESYGRPGVFEAEVRNMPPVISENYKVNFDGKVLTYQIKASDPDGDPLTYYLKSAPQGMTVNPKTGFVSWNVPADFKGKTSCTISVKDGQGGEAEYTLNIDIGDMKK